MAHRTVARRHQRAEVVKGSSFITLVAPVESLDDIEAILAETRALHPKASHHPYAYKLDGLVKTSDDGEPGGTAGRPMLEVLEKRGLEHLVAVVTRYFGGVKLGAGGLARAYGGSLAKALDEAGTREVHDRTTLRFTVPFADMDAVHRLLEGWGALEKSPPDYLADGLTLGVTLPQRDEAALRAALTETTRGRVGWLEPEAG